MQFGPYRFSFVIQILELGRRGALNSHCICVWAGRARGMIQHGVCRQQFVDRRGVSPRPVVFHEQPRSGCLRGVAPHPAHLRLPGRREPAVEIGVGKAATSRRCSAHCWERTRPTFEAGKRPKLGRASSAPPPRLLARTRARRGDREFGRHRTPLQVKEHSLQSPAPSGSTPASTPPKTAHSIP
jgi:hypothetical protein